MFRKVKTFCYLNTFTVQNKMLRHTSGFQVARTTNAKILNIISSNAPYNKHSSMPLHLITVHSTAAVVSTVRHDALERCFIFHGRRIRNRDVLMCLPERKSTNSTLLDQLAKTGLFLS